MFAPKLLRGSASSLLRGPVSRSGLRIMSTLRDADPKQCTNEACSNAKSCTKRWSSTAASPATAAAAARSSAKDDYVTTGAVHFRKTNIPHALKSNVPVAFTINPDTSEFHDNSSVWSEEEIHSVKVTHKPPVDIADKIALSGVRFLRWSFDWLAGFKTGAVSEDKYLNRVIFLETVAGIPGMVAGSLRHLSSLRRMKRDHGWIHTLLEESENERMHLLTFLYLKKPGPVFRGAVAITQVLMWNVFFATYMVNPKICHRFVGYIEEEAVHTYTTLLKEIDSGALPMFEHLGAPLLAIDYWKLPADANFRDLILAVRADEANHRVVNHTFADMHAAFKENEVNPFRIQSVVEDNGGFVESANQTTTTTITTAATGTDDAKASSK